MNAPTLSEILKIYYAKSGDKTSKVVDFLHDRPSRFFRASEYVGEGKENFVINDSFGGVMPSVLNHSFLIGKQEADSFSVDILLDSNVVSYLHRYVTDSDGRFRESQRGIATRQLIQKFTEYFDRGWDINPVFYLLEAVSKNDFQTVYPHAQALGHSVMKLQHMNHKLFLETGRVEVDEAKLAGSADSFASSSLEALSASNVLHFSTSSLVPELRCLTNVVYAALLKLSLLIASELRLRRSLRSSSGSYIQTSVCNSLGRLFWGA